MKDTYTKKIFLLLFLLHIFLIIFLYASQNDFATRDSKHYLDLAESLRNGHFGLIKIDGYYPENLRLPGYPFFILLCQTLFGYSQSAVVLPQIALYLLSVFFIYKSTVWNFGDKTALIFLCFSLFYPVIAINSLHILPNLLSLFFVSAAVFSIAKPKWRESIWSFARCGLFLDLASYQRLNLFSLGLFLAGLIFLFLKTHRKHSIILTVTLLLIISPWFVRNFFVFGSFSPSENNAGLEMLVYQNSIETLYASENGIYFRRNKFPKTYKEYDSVIIQNQLSSMKKELGLNDEDRYSAVLFVRQEKMPLAKKLLQQNAWKNIKNSGIHFGTMAVGTFMRMWSGKADSSPNNFFYPPKFIGIAFGLIALLSAIAGVFLLFFSKSENIRFYGLICVGGFIYFSLSLSFLHSEVRYAMPGKLLFLALSAYPFAYLFEYLQKILYGEKAKA